MILSSLCQDQYILHSDRRQIQSQYWGFEKLYKRRPLAGSRKSSTTTHLFYRHNSYQYKMFRSTLFALALSAIAAMTLAAPNNVKRHDDGNDNVIDVNDIGLVNVDELGKNADILNDVNLLSSEHNDDHYRYDHHDHHGYHGYHDGSYGYGFDDEHE
ncbi:hypothetical protein VTP01DRAFT_6135 [Rhizomucor pusillus]|uniref:uncharacterized protein n=1 Tax=Rhizomucor pusillus TaxID=4840 RepID=UPI003742B4BA